jgi:hypothetical protein
MIGKLGAGSKGHISDYSLKKTIQLWNKLPEDVLGTCCCKSSNFKKRVRKVINKAK